MQGQKVKDIKFESDSIMNQESEIETGTATQTEEFMYPFRPTYRGPSTPIPL